MTEVSSLYFQNETKPNRLSYLFKCHYETVPDPGEGGCADPVNGGAILGKGGQGPRGGNKERQLSPDKARRKT